MPRWAYHGSLVSLLPQIRKLGLVPEGQLQPFGNPYVFFSQFEDAAFFYARGLVLRFPFPKDARPNPHVDPSDPRPGEWGCRPGRPTGGPLVLGLQSQEVRTTPLAKDVVVVLCFCVGGSQYPWQWQFVSPEGSHGQR